MLRNDTKGKHYPKGISTAPTVLESALSSRASLPVCASPCSAHRLFLSSKQLDLGDSWHFVARQSSRPIKRRISAFYLPYCINTDAEFRLCPTLQQHLHSDASHGLSVSSRWMIQCFGEDSLS